MKNYYEILELDCNASFKEIRSSYRRLSKKYHPDINPDNKDFEDYYKDIQEAYQHLKDGIKREEFDAQLRALGIGKSKFGLFTKNIKDTFNPNRNNFEWDEEEEGNTFRPVFVRPRKRYYRGALLIGFSVVVIGGIFFIESRIDNLSYNSQISSYTSEPAVVTSKPVEELKISRDPVTEKKEVLPLEISQLPIVETEKGTFSNERKYISNVAENAKPQGETVPVTIFSVNNVGESAEDQTVVKQSDIPISTESKAFTPSSPVLASTEPKEVKVTSNESKSSSTGANSAEVNRIYTNVDRKPTFSGGASAFVQYLNSSLQYPPSARESGINGRVLVTFIVEKNGKISNIAVIQGIGGGCDEEAIRVMKNAPSWIPGENNGERVRVQCTIPITFKLQ